MHMENINSIKTEYNVIDFKMFKMYDILDNYLNNFNGYF